MNPIIYLLDMILGILNTLLIVWLVIQILLKLEIINYYNESVRKIVHAMSNLVEPLLRPARRYVPYIGGFDLSPLVLMLFIHFTRYTLRYYFA